MEVKVLMLTLGHNSSAIYFDGKEVIGYESERLDRVKSSSNFPTSAIFEILKHIGLEGLKGATVFISHWFDNLDGSLEKCSENSKRIDYNMIKSLIGMGCHIITHDEQFTHHDAHAYSSLAFLRNHASISNFRSGSKIHFIVADGFGNKEEVVSIYSSDVSCLVHNNLQLEKRIYDYQKSLGLMYQFATSFVGMKENQDEYKFLGYESGIDDVLSANQIYYLENIAGDIINNISLIYDNSTPSENKIYIDTDKLLKVKSAWHKQFSHILTMLNIDIKANNYEARVIIGFFVQFIVEQSLCRLIDAYNIENLVVSGGIFYNVKLNNKILKKIRGKLCIMPLAGDQGAAIGFFEKHIKNFPLSKLIWGKRNLKEIHKPDVYNIAKLTNENELFIANLIAEGNIVNIVKGDMEFGPRALGNTSSIFLPKKELTEYNNFINNRNEVMPCAPMIREEDMEKFFSKDLTDRIIGSDDFMIITYDYIGYHYNVFDHKGIMHKYPMKNKYSGRPQVIPRTHYMWNILKYVEKLTGYNAVVNTSFNFHGQPIVFDSSDAELNFDMQKNYAGVTLTDKTKLIIIHE